MHHHGMENTLHIITLSRTNLSILAIEGLVANLTCLMTGCVTFSSGVVLYFCISAHSIYCMLLWLLSACMYRMYEC